MTEAVPVKRAKIGFIFSFFGGLVGAGVALFLLPTYMMIQDFSDTSLPSFTLADVIMTAMIGLLLAIMVIVGAFLIHKPGRETLGSIVVIAFPSLSLLYTAGGLYVGFALGVAGGILELIKK
ncbi:MAG: hypothetical protein ACUVQ8_03710 [Nitrososphaeria archaeon]